MSNYDGNWSWSGDNEDENDEDNEQVYEDRWGSKDSVIFLIDCTKPMFVQNDDKQSCFDLTAKCVRNVMTRKIINSESDLVGIVFFGTEKSSHEDFKHIYKFQDLTLLGADQILEMEKLLKGKNNGDFANKFGHNSSFSLSDAFWVCSTMFSNCSLKIGYKRIMLFTNNDDPHKGSRDLQLRAKQKAQDLNQVGIELELLPMKGPIITFEMDKFYQDIIFSSDGDDFVDTTDATDKFDELLTRVLVKDHKKRTQGRVTLCLSEGMNISVGIYTLARVSQKPYPVKLFKNTNELVTTKTKLYLTENAEILLPSDLKKYMTFGGRHIYFEKNEVEEMRFFGTPGFLLMGFKPCKRLKPYYHVRPSQFIYPDETFIQGSTVLFAALLQKCIKRDVIPICRYIPRKNASPRFIALLPQEEKLDEQNVQITPPGFNVIFLPFTDDLRKLTLSETPKATEDQINKAKEVIKKLQFPFQSENFENPVLQKHYRNLEALALDQDNVEEITDHTEPNEEQIEKRAGKLLEQFKHLVYPSGYEPGKAVKKKAASAEGNAPKRIKLENVETIDIKKEALAGNLNKLTVPVLKGFITKTQIKSSSHKKADLIDAIYTYFNVE